MKDDSTDDLSAQNLLLLLAVLMGHAPILSEPFLARLARLLPVLSHALISFEVHRKRPVRIFAQHGPWPLG